MPLTDRDFRKLVNTKQNSIEFLGKPSLHGMVDGQMAIEKKSNSQLALYRKKYGRLWKTYMSSDGNQYVDKNLKVNNNISILGSLNINNRIIVNQSSELTISSGVITITGSLHTVDTQGDASSDDLTTINGGKEGQLLIIKAAHTARTVVLKNASANIACGSDFSLDSIYDMAILIFIGNKWLALSLQSNGT